MLFCLLILSCSKGGSGEGEPQPDSSPDGPNSENNPPEVPLLIFPNEDEFVYCDLNEDNNINIQDIILMINMILDSGYQDSGDMNSDGTIDILDIVQLVNIILN